MKKSLDVLFLLMMAFSLAFWSCKPEDPDEEEATGKLQIEFAHRVNGVKIVQDTLGYINAAGNHYMINEIQWFLSDIYLHRHGKPKIKIDDWVDYHYVDIDIPSTLSWDVYDKLPVGQYDSISFTFGLSAAKNQSFMFVNHPEVDMVWPEYLGGGYHYLKLNMKWIDTNQVLSPYAFHLGIGQTYDNQGNITGFVQNYFKVTLPASTFTIVENKTTKVRIVMDVNSWFDTPNVYDFDFWGPSIMQYQAAMATGCQNGRDAFSFELITN